jgi:O-antigen/teichoic acid export membrane protein
MLNKKQQLKNSFIYMISMGFNFILPFITLPIFTRILMPEDYGVLGLALIYAMFIGGLANFGISLAFDRNYFKYQKDIQKLGQLLSTSLIFVFGNFLILFLFTFAFRENISVLLTGSSGNGMLIVIASINYFFLSVSNYFFYAYLKNKEEAFLYSKYKVVESLLILFMSLYLVAYIKIGVIGIVLSQLIAGVLLFIAFIIKIFNKLPYGFSKTILYELLKISYPLTPMIFIGVVNTQFDKYMIGLMTTIGGVGVYHIGKRFSELVFVFMTTIQNVFQPHVYQCMYNQNGHKSESIGSYLTPFLYISTGFALSIALFSQELFILLTPENYHTAIPIVSVLSIYYGSLFFGKIPQLIYVKKTHISTIIFILSIILNIGLNIPFIMKYGVMGAAWATMLAGVISSSIRLIVAQHYYKINYEWKKISWIMGIFFTGSIIVVSLFLLGTPYLWNLFIKGIIVIIFVNLGIRYDIVTKENFIVIYSSFRFKSVATT